MCPPDHRCPHRIYGRPRSLARVQRQGDMAVHRVLWHVGRILTRLERRHRLWERRAERRQLDMALHMAEMPWRLVIASG